MESLHEFIKIGVFVPLSAFELKLQSLKVKFEQLSHLLKLLFIY